VAVIITFGASLGFLLVNYIGSAGNRVVEYLSVTGHLEDFIKGVIDTSHVVYYLTFAFLALFLAYRSLESMRWRG
jgi:ABC-2 type transport system permease protein